MGDMGDVFNAMKARTKAHRAKMLERADTSGWVAFTKYHFMRMFNGKRMDWWPSGGKAKFEGRMIYGHRQVNALIARLKEAEGKEEK